MAQLEDAVKSLSIWVPRGVVILSLVSHLVLAVFSEIRRRKADGCRRNLVWVAYQMTEWAPTYVLGNLYLETTPHDKLIIAFWLPFLLQHHARPDNISADSMEDNTLWDRRMIFVPFQIVGALYVLYRYILADSAAGFLRQASWITFFLGIFKYVESAFALLRGNLDFIRSSFKPGKRSSRPVGNYDGGEELLDDEKALLVAHDLFDICKGAFSDYSVDYIDREAVKSIFSGHWKNMSKVVEMELTLMYDILYTKTPMVHTPGGYVIRVASPPLTVAVIALFYLHPRDRMKTEDFVITQILLWTTFLLDVRWLVRALVSTWTHSFLKARPHCWFNHEIMCQGLWKKLRCFVVSLCPSKLSLWLWTCEFAKEAKSYRTWELTIGQRNLLDECTAGDSSLSRTVGRNEIEPEYQYLSRGIDVSHHVMELVFRTICTEFFPAPVPSGSPGTEIVSSQGDGDDESQSQNNISPSSGTEGSPPSRWWKWDNLLGRWWGWDNLLGRWTRKTRAHIAEAPPGPRKWDNLLGRWWEWDSLLGRWTRKTRSQTAETPLGPQWDNLLGRWWEWDNLLGRWTWTTLAQAANAPPYEQQADHWSVGYTAYMYDEPQTEPYEQQADHWRHVNAACTYGQPATPNKQYDDDKAMESEDEDMKFPLEFQEAILIWHITTNIFLSHSNNKKEAQPVVKSVIQRLSDYMVFLVNDRPSMLPGLKLRSLYETARLTLQKIRSNQVTSEGYKPSGYSIEEKKEFAVWMLDKMGDLKGPNTATTAVWEGTQHARLLLESVQKLEIDPELDSDPKILAASLERLAYWIPGVKDPPEDMEKMLEFISKAWVRLLIYASIRCSRESHANQLGCGGELTTIIWILSEHAEIKFVKKYMHATFGKKPPS